MRYYRSPIPYMGNKYKLLKDIIPLFPKECDIFIDGFGGSGVVSMNYQGTKETIYNEFNENIIALIEMIINNSPEELDKYWNNLIDEFNLPRMSVTSLDRLERDEYARRAVSFNKLREHYNKSRERDYRELFLLIRYSINHLIRFNSNSEFNAPNGCDAYNKAILKDVKDMHKIFKKVTISCNDFFKLDLSKLTTNSFVYCYDKETEVLTNNGWKYLKDVDINKDLFLSREPNTDIIEYVKADNYITYHYKGNMWCYNSDDIDLVVTPNHRLFLDKRKQLKHKRIRNEILIPTTDILDKGTDLSFIRGGGKYLCSNIDDRTIEICNQKFDKKIFAHLLGIFITDGSVNNQGAITISQTKISIKNKIFSLLNELGLEYSLYGDINSYSNATFYIHRKYLPYFNQFYLKKNRRIPAEFKDTDIDIMCELLDGILDGDSDAERRKIYVGSKALADDIQELIFKCGYGSTIHIKYGRDVLFKSNDRVIHGRKPFYVISLLKRKYLSYVNSNVNFKSYDDNVYCVALEKYHTLLIRRNGKTIWCGNCDCPYTNTQAVYNEKRAFGGWGIDDDKKLFQVLENLNKRGIKWGLSNVFENRGIRNEHLVKWCKENNWNVHHLERNYNPFRGGKKSNSDEVFITNYEDREQKLELW